MLASFAHHIFGFIRVAVFISSSFRSWSDILLYVHITTCLSVFFIFFIDVIIWVVTRLWLPWIKLECIFFNQVFVLLLHICVCLCTTSTIVSFKTLYKWHRTVCIFLQTCFFHFSVFLKFVSVVFCRSSSFP